MFFIYISKSMRWVMVHRAECPHAEHRAGPNAQLAWFGPFESFGAAMERARDTSLEIKLCRQCKPGTGPG